MNSRVDTSPKVADEVKTTTCYMCACRCGIKVHLKDGEVRYIQGNPDHPVNKGVLCAKGSAGIMQQYSPARLSKPLLRVGERGSGEFKEIEWSEAIQTAVDWLAPIREDDPKKLAFFTGRDGRRNSVRRIMRHMAASARSIWRPAVSIPSVVPSGNSASLTGSIQNIL